MKEKVKEAYAHAAMLETNSGIQFLVRAILEKKSLK